LALLFTFGARVTDRIKKYAMIIAHWIDAAHYIKFASVAPSSS
jgi:hypothetical protein